MVRACRGTLLASRGADAVRDKRLSRPTLKPLSAFRQQQTRQSPSRRRRAFETRAHTRCSCAPQVWLCRRANTRAC
jgi:hypothetical protein